MNELFNRIQKGTLPFVLNPTFIVNFKVKSGYL